MTSTYPNAIDEILDTFNVEWEKPSTAAIVGYTPQVFWPGIERPKIPPTNLYYVEVETSSVSEDQKTLSNFVDGVGKKRYNNKGMLFVNIFAPLSDSKHMELGGDLSVVAQNSLRGKTTTSCIYFTNVVILNMGHSSKFFHFRVVADYNYDDIG
ncbi:hypothetical protein COB55_04920 [Candidatus Wolfebacteria bacterium]|nr:MAG: hypothetical protein COB55_04920 [Candidatus Wolfebacteria bacterium]